MSELIIDRTFAQKYFNFYPIFKTPVFVEKFTLKNMFQVTLIINDIEVKLTKQELSEGLSNIITKDGKLCHSTMNKITRREFLYENNDNYDCYRDYISSYLDYLDENTLSIVLNSLLFFGYNSLEAYITMQLIARQADYFRMGIIELKGPFESNLFTRTHLFIKESNSFKPFKTLNSFVICSWFIKTNNIRMVHLNNFNDNKYVSYDSRRKFKELINS